MPIVSMAPGLDGDLDLGADAVGRGDQHRVGEAGALEVEQAAEPADLRIRARPRGRPYQRLDQVDHAVAGVDVDAGIRVGEAAPRLVVHRSALPVPGGRTAESGLAQWSPAQYEPKRLASAREG